MTETKPPNLRRMNKIRRVCSFIQESGYMTPMTDKYICAWLDNGPTVLPKDEWIKAWREFCAVVGEGLLLRVSGGNAEPSE